MQIQQQADGTIADAKTTLATAEETQNRLEVKAKELESLAKVTDVAALAEKAELIKKALRDMGDEGLLSLNTRIETLSQAVEPLVAKKTPSSPIYYSVSDLSGDISLRLYVGKERRLFHTGWYSKSSLPNGKALVACTLPRLTKGEHSIYLEWSSNSGHLVKFELSGTEQTFNLDSGLHSAKDYDQEDGTTTYSWKKPIFKVFVE